MEFEKDPQELRSGSYNGPYGHSNNQKHINFALKRIIITDFALLITNLVLMDANSI